MPRAFQRKAYHFEIIAWSMIRVNTIASQKIQSKSLRAARLTPRDEHLVHHVLGMQI
jgi:hypothetical protein